MLGRKFMKFLIITQKVNCDDDILGFFHRWLQEFSRQAEFLTIICLEKGEYDLASNCEVLSLGKEKGKSRLRYVINFYRHIWSRRKEYDAVFVHMNPVYIILGWAVWKGLGKKIGLWYTHKHVDFKLWLASKFCDFIMTASAESFRLASRKVNVLGHGIDTDFFKPEISKEKHTICNILSVGRIAPVKNQLLLVAIAKELRRRQFPFRVIIAGEAITSTDKAYRQSVVKEIKASDLEEDFEFAGSVSNRNIVAYYQRADVVLNLSDTGSLDKVVLEALACNVPVLTMNEAFRPILPSECLIDRDSVSISQRIVELAEQPAEGMFRDYVVKNHNLKKLITRIVGLYEQFS